MKTFEQIFPELQPTDKYLIWVNGDEVRMDRDYGKCGVCENQTRFYSISFMGRYCSISCLNHEWNTYAKASRKRNIVDDES